MINATNEAKYLIKEKDVDVIKYETKIEELYDKLRSYFGKQHTSLRLKALLNSRYPTTTSALNLNKATLL